MTRADAQPVRAPPRRGRLVRRRPGSRPCGGPHVPRLADPQRHPLRDAPRARLPAACRSSTSRRTACRARGRSASPSARPGSPSRATPPGGSHRTLSDAGTLEDGVFETPFARVEPLAGWVLRQNGRAVPLEPKALRDAVADGLARLRDAHEGEALAPARERRVDAARRPRRPARRADRARAVRRPPGAARAPPLRLRREPRRAARRRRARRALLDPARGAPGHALAAQSRQLRRRLLHGLRRGRRGHGRRAGRQGAVRRRLPAGRRS